MPAPDSRQGPHPPSRLLAGGLVLAAVGLAALVAALGQLAIDPAVSEAAGRANLARLWPFWGASALGWAGLTVAWAALARGAGATAGRGAAAVVLAVAAAARVATLAVHEPALSDDVYRYVFDGRNLAAGTNPYLARPEDAAADPESWPGRRAVAARVNNPELYTIYLPASQWFFAATARVLPAMSPAATVRAFRAALVLAELAAIGLVLLVLARLGRSPWWAALYAWHPLAVTEVAGSGHQEPVGLALLVLALAVWTARPRRIAAWTVPLAAAALVKPVVVPIAPLLLRGRSWRAWAGCAAIGAATCALLAAPLLHGTALAHLLATSSRFSLKWAHFGSVYEPLLWLIERLAPGWGNDPQELLARGLCAAALAAVVALVLVRARTAWSGAAAILLAMVLLSPSAHPWYLLWALLFMPMAPGPALWTASLTISWGYVAWRYVNTQEGGVGWGVAPWVMVLAWAPVYLAALVPRLLPRRASP